MQNGFVGVRFLDGDTPWCTPSQSTVTAKLVAGLTLCLYFLEQCWCFSTICNDDGNGIAIPSHHQGLDSTSSKVLSQSSATASCRLLGRFLCLSSSSNVNATWWQAMTMELSSQPPRIQWQYSMVYAILKHSHCQVGSWTGTLSLLPWAMSMLLNNMPWWWQWIAIPSHLLRIGQHIHWCAVTKFSHSKL